MNATVAAPGWVPKEPIYRRDQSQLQLYSDRINDQLQLGWALQNKIELKHVHLVPERNSAREMPRSVSEQFQALFSCPNIIFYMFDQHLLNIFHAQFQHKSNFSPPRICRHCHAKLHGTTCSLDWSFSHKMRTLRGVRNHGLWALISFFWVFGQRFRNPWDKRWKSLKKQGSSLKGTKDSKDILKSKETMILFGLIVLFKGHLSPQNRHLSGQDWHLSAQTGTKKRENISKR